MQLGSILNNPLITHEGLTDYLSLKLTQVNRFVDTLERNQHDEKIWRFHLRTAHAIWRSQLHFVRPMRPEARVYGPADRGGVSEMHAQQIRLSTSSG